MSLKGMASLPVTGSPAEQRESSSLGLLLGKAGWAVHSAQGWWKVGVGRPQPKKRTCILPGGLLNHDIGSAPTEASPSFGLREADWRGVVGCLLPAHPPQLILIFLVVLPLARPQNQRPS